MFTRLIIERGSIMLYYTCLLETLGTCGGGNAALKAEGGGI